MLEKGRSQGQKMEVGVRRSERLSLCLASDIVLSPGTPKKLALLLSSVSTHFSATLDSLGDII